jgi:hypothetical protein
MSATASGFDARIGWRDVGGSPSDLGWIEAAVAPTVCTATACETRIPLATLGGRAGGTIAMFARITNATGASFSNQCLPEDAPATPATVAVLLTLAHP